MYGTQTTKDLNHSVRSTCGRNQLHDFQDKIGQPPNNQVIPSTSPGFALLINLPGEIHPLEPRSRRTPRALPLGGPGRRWRRGLRPQRRRGVAAAQTAGRCQAGRPTCFPFPWCFFFLGGGLCVRRMFTDWDVGILRSFFVCFNTGGR